MNRFEASLTEEGRYHLLVNSITDYAIYMLDPEGCVTSWNAGARRFKGYSESEIIGKHFSIFYTDEDRREGLPSRALENAARDGKFEDEGWRLRKDGKQFWAHVVVDPVRDRAGKLVGYAKITRDLSERLEAREDLRRTEEQFTLLLQNVADYAIYQLDPEGRVMTWNVGAERIKYYSPDEIIGRHFSLFYTNDDVERGEPMRALGVAAREGKYETEGWRVRKDGSVFWASVVIAPIVDRTGVVGFAKVIRDLTEVKKNQLELERSRDALLQSQKMAALGGLTSGLANDFNNILAAVVGGLDLIRERLPEDPHITPLLEGALKAAQRGKSMTRRMSAFARRQELQPAPTDLVKLVGGMMAVLQRTLGPSFTIETNFPEAIGPVQVDPAQLELAVLNLTMNARDAMPDGGLIAISARDGADTVDDDGSAVFAGYVCLSVRDAGDGMDTETLALATEPFFTTKSFDMGAGLGLPMVRAFAEQSGGRFILRSRRGVGTVADLWLPCAARSPGQLGTAGRNASFVAAVQRQAETRGLAIVVVDDDRLMLMDTTVSLNKLGHTVFAATSGEAALDIIRRSSGIDLVVIDHGILGMSAADLVEAIRLEWPTLPIIFATPLASAALQTIPKPFGREELVRAIGQAQVTGASHGFN